MYVYETDKELVRPAYPEGTVQNWIDLPMRRLVADDSIYEGCWKNKKMDGFGKQTFVDGSIYEGMFKEGTFCGHGRYITDKGNLYVGNFLNGLRDG